MKSLLTSSASLTPRMPSSSSLSLASMKAWLISSTLVARLKITEKSTSETVGVGTRTA